MVTDVQGQKYDFKKMKKPGLWGRGMVTGGPGQKSDFKKMTQSVGQCYGHWWVKLSTLNFDLNFDLRMYICTLETLYSDLFFNQEPSNV